MIETKKRKSENPNTLVRMPLAKDVGFLIQQSEICQKKKKKVLNAQLVLSPSSIYTVITY